MSPADLLTLIILILIFVILAATWFFLKRIIKNLQRISNDLQNTIDKLKEWKHRWIY